ncbi:MAG: pyridoxamine 5'-phosphate oxidase family protein [Clostridiales Family XIII bacterium]|jgi:nitroimidazol reductase NimA-like FMN-containing flavoprotein (pyridoxamine 5'-phosphate oxidase superfamily)|nr:pyridoxamine 5'-phosphate oxidase family protein [Clostridiales Family XIII bacterium]
MRNANQEIKETGEIRSIVKRCDVCRVGLAVDGGAPYIVPMNFGFEFDAGGAPEMPRLTLWFHGATEGRKLDLIADGCSAGFEMDTDHKLLVGESSCNYSMNYASIIGSGRIARVTEEDEKLHGLKAIMAHYGGAGRPFNEDSFARTCVLRLDVAEYACKRLQGA